MFSVDASNFELWNRTKYPDSVKRPTPVATVLHYWISKPLFSKCKQHVLAKLIAGSARELGLLGRLKFDVVSVHFTRVCGRTSFNAYRGLLDQV